MGVPVRPQVVLLADCIVLCMGQSASKRARACVLLLCTEPSYLRGVCVCGCLNVTTA